MRNTRPLLRKPGVSHVIQWRFLLQGGSGDEPLAELSFAGGLAGGSVTRIGVEQVAVVLNLIAVAR